MARKARVAFQEAAGRQSEILKLTLLCPFTRCSSEQEWIVMCGIWTKQHGSVGVSSGTLSGCGHLGFRVRRYRFAQPPAKFWQAFGLASSARN